MGKKFRYFVAYPSGPPALEETIEMSIKEIRNGSVVDIKGWKSLDIKGHFVVNQVCSEIGKCDVFVCDLTGLNRNVLFELGYAIARNKRIWPLRNAIYRDDKKAFREFDLLSTVGHSFYENSNDIIESFYDSPPHDDLGDTIYKRSIEPILELRDDDDGLLYMKTEIETEASIRLTRLVSDVDFLEVTTDDPREVRIQPLHWYARKINESFGVISHFLSPDHLKHEIHNAKLSFVSGLAVGRGKELLMLAHAPFESPLDYRDYLHIHETAEQCVGFANHWISNTHKKYYRRDKDKRDYSSQVRAKTKLQKLDIGTYIAEDESSDLEEYFVPTSAYQQALSPRSSIFIGRKGSGKTANFYQLSITLEDDVRNHVCTIKPVAYELAGVLEMLQNVESRSERGFLIESFWKFLLYTELAKSFFQDLDSKPLYYNRSEGEDQLYNFVTDNEDLVIPEFSVRMEAVVNRIGTIDQTQNTRDTRIKISERLHSDVLGNLRDILIPLVANSNRVAILVDNLDKAWERNSKLKSLADFLFGLLQVSQDITEEFRRFAQDRSEIDFSLILFLRSDIFSQVRRFSREPDKIQYERINWEDGDLLIRVLEKRFMKAGLGLASPDAIWNELFESEVDGMPIRDYLVRVVLPRPRDLIYIATEGIAQAVNHGHTKITKNDIFQAEKRYSRYALDSLLVENGFRVSNVEELLYGFVGSPSVISAEVVVDAMKEARISEDKLDEVVELLIDLTFLGVETRPDQFNFLHNEDERQKLMAMASKMARKRGDESRYQINRPFHSYLEIERGPA